MKKFIYNITPFSLLDYPGKVSAIVWFVGCNMRCGYCYNPDVVLGKGAYTLQDALAFFENRKQLLDAVVFSGGECTLHKEIYFFARELKQLGYFIKIDTNGADPALLKKMIEQGLVDYVAMDFKAPASKYPTVTNANVFDRFEMCFDILQTSKIPFEVRTTVHFALLKQADIDEMCAWLYAKNYKGNYYLQYALKDVEMLQPLPNSIGEIVLDSNQTIHHIPIVFRN